ncbi:uncharacterized protein LOC119185806 isoform X2 [Rhipicephalus microplus]|uniref:uncharacterized protein LOC119185806 isoform X2 n=1 Tax=Rhipicephalus microplus TaxID=6941 RepID=UPI003F6D49CF
MFLPPWVGHIVPMMISLYAYCRAQVVAACEGQPFPEPTEDSTGKLPHFENLYKAIREVMENHVPAALGDCELWLMRRLLWTIGNIIYTFDLDASKEALYQALCWAAAQPADGYSKPAGQNEKQCQGLPSQDTMQRCLNFPSMKECKDGLRSSWNPLQMPPNVIQTQWGAIQEYLAQNASRLECVMSSLPKKEIPSTFSVTAARNVRAFRKKTDSRCLEAFNGWTN